MPGFGPQPVNIDTDPTNFFSVDTSDYLGNHAGLANVNVGPYIDKDGNFFIERLREKKSDNSGFFNIEKSIDGMNFVTQDAANALVNLPGPTYAFTGSDRHLCSNIIWCAFYKFGTAKLVLKSFDMSTGLWGATSPDGPQPITFTVVGWPIVLSNGNVVVLYFDDLNSAALSAIEYNGTSWGSITVIDTGTAIVTIMSASVDVVDNVWFMYQTGGKFKVASYKGGVATTPVTILTGVGSAPNTQVYSGPGKYDSVHDIILFPLGYSRADLNPPVLSPMDLNLVSVSSASTVPVVNSIEGIANRPTSPTGNPWASPSVYFTDPTMGTYNVSIVEYQQVGQGFTPPLCIIHNFSRPATGGAWSGPNDFSAFDWSIGPLPALAIFSGYNPSITAAHGLGAVVGTVPDIAGRRTEGWLNDKTNFSGRSPCEAVAAPQAIMLSMGEGLTDVTFAHMS